MYTLGINAVFHDSSACLVQDGRLVAAAEEERFTRIKHGKRPVPFSTWELPFHAIAYCLQAAGIVLTEVDHIAYSFDPHILLGNRPGDFSLPLEPSANAAGGASPWEALFLSYVLNAPRQLASGRPLRLERWFRGARPDGPYEWHFVEHHLSHAASAFHVSPFADAAVMTLDGRGETATTTYNVGTGADLRRLGQVHMPHSLGLLYEQVTDYLGFLHSSDEYKVMALASYGKPAYVPQLRQIVQLGDKGQYRVEALHAEERFGPRRLPGDPLEARHFDLARSLQQVLEETVLEIARWLRAETGAERLCLAGGVALNCVLNARLRDCAGFEDVWAQPAAGDAGSALGAAIWIDNQARGRRGGRMDDAYLGPAFEDTDIEHFLVEAKMPYERPANLVERLAELLAEDKIAGWFQGRMEFGPRALGARSILASPLHADMQQRLNGIKDREDFRPVAPAVLEEDADDWFVNAGRSPFMLFVHDVVPERADRIPAVRHVDGTARIQTVRREDNALYYELLRAFKRRTGVPVLINTSFNSRGEPIVCTPRHALECFWSTPLDVLAIGPFLLTKPGA